MRNSNYETRAIPVVACQYNGSNISELIDKTKADLRESPLGELFLFIGNEPAYRMGVGDWVVALDEQAVVYQDEKFNSLFVERL